MDKKKITLVYTISILMILGLLGYTYSYFSATVTEENKTETVIKTKGLSLTFEGTSEINTSNMIPGDSFTKTFTVENTSTVKTFYNIYMENITNEFNEDLVYTLTDKDGEIVSETQLPQTNSGKEYLVSDIEIEVGEKKEYTLKIEYKYLDTPQNEYQGATFSATVGVDTVKVETPNTSIKVDATDSQGNNLNATASNITGEEKERLLTSLEETGYITNKDEVDALIEVESDDFENLATTTFDVSNIAKTGDTVVILHFDEEKQEWEYIGTEIVNAEGKVIGDFTSYSPVAFVVVKEDGTFENIMFNKNIAIAYTYNQTSGASNYCVTGNESTCKETTCYESNDGNSCASGTIVDYKVNDTDTIRFHVMYDKGDTLILQTQKNVLYNTEWINANDYKNTNINGTSCSSTSCNDEGPITLLNALEEETGTWKYVNEQTYTMGTTIFKTNAYTGCTSTTCTINSYTLLKKNSKARAITLQEAVDLGCTADLKSCPVWMYNYLRLSTNYDGTVNDTTTKPGIYGNNGYWTMNTDSSSNVNTWGIGYGGIIGTNYAYATDIGVRAVVEINK